MLLLLFIIFIIALCFMAGWYVLGCVLIAILFIFFVAAIIENNKNAEKKRIQQDELKARNAERIIDALPMFIRYINEEWIPNHAMEYFKKRDPIALDYLPKLLGVK